MLLSGLLHGNDYFVGHLRHSSAWLNVMDGEEMVMSETLQVLPDQSHSMIIVAEVVSAKVLYNRLDAAETFINCSLLHHTHRGTHLEKKLSIMQLFILVWVKPGTKTC